MRFSRSVIGSCTNGRIDDMRVAAEILKGRKVDHKDVRTIIIPATQAVYLQCIEEGLDRDLHSRLALSFPRRPAARASAVIWASWRTGERAVSTTNRNFVGRMGHITSEIYLASPAVAAASAVAGYICAPDDSEVRGGNTYHERKRQGFQVRR